MRFLHIADCHVGCRQYGMKERELDFYRALASAADAAVDNKCDAMVVAGDLFDAVKPPAEAVCVVKDVVNALKDKGVRVLGIEGNHDLTGDSYWLRVCGIEPLDRRVVNVGGVRFSGFNYQRSDSLIQSLADFSEPSTDENNGCDVLVLHTGLVEMGDSFTGDLSVNSIMPYLKKLGVKYVALGHIHTYMEPVYDGIHFVQPGSTELKDVSEQLNKRAMLVEISDGVVTQQPVPLKTRPVEVITVKNEDELHELLESGDTRKAFDGHLVVLYVANSIKDGVKRIEEMFSRHEVLFRISVFDDGNGAAAPEYDRTKAIPTLAAAVDEFFEKGTEQHLLTSAILETPANVRQIVENYMNNK
jgi:DNA repair exonuclease SbcCD nuclease subunit